MIALPQPQVLEITGADAVAFAHAQFSNDVRGLQNGHWQWNAWLSPQGRVRAFFHLLRSDEQHLQLLLRGGAAQDLRSQLAPYVLRAKVELYARQDLHACGSEAAAEVEPPPSAYAFLRVEGSTTLALSAAPPRWLILREAATEIAPSDAQLEHWRLLDIGAGLPELAPKLADQLLPQWLGLDRLGAISVRKGCYPGQEVMSRLHFKGGNKRSLFRLELAATEAPAPGTGIGTASGETAGQIIMAAHRNPNRVEALASLNDSAASDTLRCADSAIERIVALV